MGSTDAKKSKKKKSRKVGRTLAASLSVPQTPLSTLDSEEIEQMTQLMDAGETSELVVPAFSQAPNPFLSGHQCLLCRCERPHLPKFNGDVCSAGEDGSDGGISSISQLPPWVCHECRKTVEEEEKRTEVPMSALMEPDLRLEPPVLPLLSDLGSAEPVTENGSLCQCKACTERRHIEAEQERESQGLLHCWTELRHIIHSVYHQRAPTSCDDAGISAVSPTDVDRAKEFVHRLCVRDPHKLFQRLDEQGQEYVLEVKKYLLHQLASGNPVSALLAKQFLATLLDEYDNLCSTADTLALILAELEQLHLKQFHVTCELHSKHLFHALIYMEEGIQNRLHKIFPQLSLGSTGNEEVQDDTTARLLQRYMKFDDDMSIVSVMWRECQQVIERYDDEQAVLIAKRKMLKEDWEFFKQQRKLLQQQQQQHQRQEQQEQLTKCGASSPTTSPHTVELVEAQFTHMMERILQGSKPSTNEYYCPNCNRKRCPCDECSISHMITCGIIHPDLLDQIHQPGGATAASGGGGCVATPVKFPNELYSTLNVRPPSMSSTCSSSGSESPIIVDPERLALPFDDDDEDNLDLVDDIGEEEDSRSANSDDSSGDEEEDGCREQRGPDWGIAPVTTDGCSASQAACLSDGLEGRGADLERAVSYAASLNANYTSFSFNQQPQTMASCECISCTLQPEAPQVGLVEETQCQCHACLQQQRHTQPPHAASAETLLSQHFPILPQPPGSQALHLYPHIHGANIMHPTVAAGTTAQHPLLQPQLYELHSPLPPPQPQQLVLKPVTSACMSTTHPTHQLNHLGHYVDGQDVRLAVSSDKLYHACLGWENAATVNGGHLMLSPQYEATHSVNGMVLSADDQFASVAAPTPAMPLFQQCSLATAPSTSSTSRFGGAQGASVVFSAPVPGLNPRVPDAHAAAGMKRTLLNPACQAVPIHNFTPVIGGAALGSSGDMCMKHNPFVYMTNHSSLSNTPHTTTISTSQPTASPADVVNDDLMRGGCCDNVTAAAPLSHQDQMYALSHGRMHAPNMHAPNMHAPNAAPNLVNMSHVTRMQQQQGRTTAPLGVPAPPPGHHHHHPHPGLVDATNSDVSSTAGSMCLEADSCGHNDDNCDSNDDSCSEQSSSTSTSNQKDGKYCDCCYCEFFGHSTPPTLPTSRNYPEIRDRLRLRLKQRNEARTQKDKEILTPASPPKNEIADQRELDELLRFINGGGGGEEGGVASSGVASGGVASMDAPAIIDSSVTPADNKLTAKAAKRARQKQRKAEDKAKKEEEEELRQALLEQRQAKLEYQQLLKKKRRHREQHNTPPETPTAAVANGSTSCKLAAPVAGRTMAAVTRPEKIHQSFGAVVSANGQHRLPTPVVTHKKSCHSAVASEAKPVKDPGEVPCVAPQPLTRPRRQPQQGDRAKKLASKHQLPSSAGMCGCTSNVDDGSPRRTPSIKVKKSADAIDVHAHNRWNKQTTGQSVIARPQQTNHCSQAKSARQNCVSGGAAHKTAVSNGPVPAKTCASISCGGRATQNCDTSRVTEPKNHHVATNKDQTACLQRLMQQHNISAAVAKPCHNFTTDATSSHAAQPVTRKKGHKLYQELGSHLPTQPTVPSRSARPPATSNYNHVDRHHDSGHSSLVNNVAALSLSGPGQESFENVAWKQDRKPPTVTASRSKGDVERANRDNGQNSGSLNKNKKNRRKNKANDDMSSLDEIFLPKEDVEHGELDEFEREIEEFKRFCLDSTPAEKREKVQVTMNMKDIFSKKKSGLLA